MPKNATLNDPSKLHKNLASHELFSLLFEIGGLTASGALVGMQICSNGSSHRRGLPS